MLPHYAIIVAAGTGKRFSTDIPKQFVMLHNHPVVIQTLLRFREVVPDENIIICVNELHIDLWKNLEKTYSWMLGIKKIFGGNSRAQSVKNALAFLKDPCLVAVHDAVRPVVSIELIENSFILAGHSYSAIPYVSVTDSLRRMDTDVSIPVNNSKYIMVQSPQAFHSEVLIKSYEKIRGNESDDATAVQNAGNELMFFPGERTNIKIIYEDDLQIAQYYLQMLP